ncbi:hypothetical protein P9112_011138 [Eukaryota sp. TZLM1-RC]
MTFSGSETFKAQYDRIQVIRCDPSQRKPVIEDDKLGFGKHFTSHMFVVRHVNGEWQEPKIIPYGPLEMSPSAKVLHYGQSCFEGMKAYPHKDGQAVSLFRPYENAARFNLSASRLTMPEVDEDLFVAACQKLIEVDAMYMPKSAGTAMYIRPTMMGESLNDALGLSSSAEFTFFIILSPVGPYFAAGFKPVKILVEPHYVRAAPGGTGDRKVAGNYASSLLAAKIAAKKGYQQVLWLDAIHHKYLEEVGAMNLFVVIGDTIITAPLKGSILPGITRKSVIDLARQLGYTVEERDVSIDEVVEAHKEGNLNEIFGTGTAASIAPVGQLGWDDKDYVVNEFKVGPITQQLYDTLVQLQCGDIVDENKWRFTFNV